MSMPDVDGRVLRCRTAARRLPCSSGSATAKTRCSTSPDSVPRPSTTPRDRKAFRVRGAAQAGTHAGGPRSRPRLRRATGAFAANRCQRERWSRSVIASAVDDDPSEIMQCARRPTVRDQRPKGVEIQHHDIRSHRDRPRHHARPRRRCCARDRHRAQGRRPRRCPDWLRRRWGSGA